MKQGLTRILVWLGIMALLTVIAMGLWMAVSGGSQSTVSLKWLQLLQTVATFLLPGILGAWFWSEDHKPFRWLKMDRSVSWQTALSAIAVMLCAIPAINLLADLNSRIQLPESLDFIEQILRQQEEAAAALTERFLQADNIWILLINIGLMALLPALAEETCFRGTLQQIIAGDNHPGTGARVHIAIWLSAFIFSAIHMQFYGFIPRMLLGAMFGYALVWTGSLWVPILMHFTNNGMAVMAYYITQRTASAPDETSIMDTIGTGDTWWTGVISIIATIALLGLIYQQTKKTKQNETM
ncbi:MAG: CPBP family intramembrane metalloprotease [Paludibacteraceae bacterium]|nr:CPBP family intramembrane metalloprotease [Paludibacteraceae bacterium]